MRKFLSYPFLLVVLLACGSFVGKSRLPKEFAKRLKETQLEFVLKSKDYEETPIIKNRQMNYDYALKHKSRDFEIRFSLRSYASYVEDAKKAEAEGRKMAQLDKLVPMNFRATVANISGGQFPEYNQFPPDAVKKEFNADWGAVTVCDAGKEFGQEYKYCMVVTIYKTGIAQAYMFYLTSEKTAFADLFNNEVLHSLKFK